MQLRAKERQGWPPSHSRDTHGEGPSQQTQERSGSVFPKETHEKGLDVTHRLRETPIGTTWRCRLTPVGMAVLKNTGDSRRWRGVCRTGTPRALPVGGRPGAATLESRVETPQNIQDRAPALPGNPTPGRLPTGTETGLRDCTPVHHCLILNSEDAETTSVHRR